MFRREGRCATTILALILDIVVYEKSIVEQFDRHCRSQGRVSNAAKGPTGGDTQSGAESLSRAAGVRWHEVVQVAARLTGGEPLEKRSHCEGLVFFKTRLDEGEAPGKGMSAQRT
jgi:hypothetical protein